MRPIFDSPSAGRSARAKGQLDQFDPELIANFEIGNAPAVRFWARPAPFFLPSQAPPRETEISNHLFTD
jgi:hypothetical protein